MSDSSAPVPTPAPPPADNSSSGFPPAAIMERMMDIQEKRLALDGRQMDLNEANLDRDTKLALKSMEYEAAARTENHTAMQRIMGWRYILLGIAFFLAITAIIVALFLGKEKFVIDALQYIAVFIGGYGTKSAVQGSKKKPPPPEEE